MTDSNEHERIYLKIEGLMAASKARDDLLNIRFTNLEQSNIKILDQVKRTNGRVTDLEQGMTFLVWLRKNKWYIGIFMLAFMKVYETVPFKKFYDFAIKLLTTWI
jgi:hypothetical protein